MNKDAVIDHSIHELLAKRWSPCAFDSRPVSVQDLQSLFEAARWAASSYNEQPWYYLIATRQQPEEFERLLSCLVEGNQAWAKTAPVLAISVASLTFKLNGKPNTAAIHDLGAAACSLTLEATARGLMVHQMIGILPDRARELYGIPESHEAVTGLAIGYLGDAVQLPEKLRQRDLAPRTRRPLREFVFEGRWGKISAFTDNKKLERGASSRTDTPPLKRYGTSCVPHISGGLDFLPSATTSIHDPRHDVSYFNLLSTLMITRRNRMRAVAQWLVGVSCVLALGGGLAQAEEAAVPQTVAEKNQQAAMEALKQRGSPNENHQVFEPLVGNWTYTAQWWMSPEAPPQAMTGASTNTLIFGGRFLKQDITGQAEGQPPFEGLGFTGYDNIRKEYQSVWFDNMATGMMVGAGQFDAAAKALTAQGDFSCPITGESHRWFRTAWAVVDQDHATYDSYSRTPEGREFTSLEIHYTRTP